MAMWRSNRRTPKDLPVDVVEEILLRLPVKHVLRCKLLSKTYFELIKTTTFNKKYLLFHHQFASTNRNIVATLMSHTNSCKTVFLLPSPSEVYIPDPAKSAADVIMVGSCNGLLCAVVHMERPYNVNTSFILLWNPLTREHMTIPPSPILPFPCVDPMGFGYDATTDDYKLVKISQRSQLELWSFKTNSWREVDIQEHKSSMGKLYLFPSTGLFVRGNLYWLSYDKRDDRIYPVLESFDLVTNSFCAQPILADVIATTEGFITTVIDFMGSLACSVHFHDLNRHLYDVWVMDDDNNNSWRKQFSTGPFPPSIYFFRTSVDGKFLMAQRNFAMKLVFFWYDPRNKEQNEISLDQYQPTVATAVKQTWSFVESMASFSTQSD